MWQKYLNWKTLGAGFLLLGMLFGAAAPSLAKHTKQHRQECLRNAQLVFFKAVDRAMTTYSLKKKSCRDNITTVDNYLRCLNRASASYESAINAAKRSYFRARLSCSGVLIWKGQDRVLIPRK